MPTPYDYLGKVVSFSVYPASIIGTRFEFVKILAILDADSTLSWHDPVSMHKSVYPTIPELVRPANDPRSYHYYKVQLPNDRIYIVGLPWVDGAITVHESSNLTVKINGAGPTDIEKIRKLLIANGFTDIEISID